MFTRRGTRRAIVFVVLLALVVGGCTDGDEPEGATPRASSDAGPFTIRLTAGSRVAGTTADAELVEGDALSDETVAAIEDRLPPFAENDDDSTPFNRPPEPLPRPRVGRTIDRPFGGGDDRAKPDPVRGPLEVLRFQPEGDVDVAPDLSVTFDQPMIPLATLEELDPTEVPIEVTPELNGHWRWIGTRTLRFVSDDPKIDRLPMATTFEVEVPAGTRSQSGGTLGESVRWSFTTPAPRVLSFGPEKKTVSRSPIFVATFDQRIDQRAVLRSIELKAAGDERSIRLATPEEVAEDRAARDDVDNAEDDRWIAFTPVAPLPADTAITVDVGPDTPSAEGPRRTARASTHTASTYAALEVAQKRCAGVGGCRTDTPFTIRFNNALDAEAFDPDTITVSPESHPRVGVYGTEMVIEATWKPNTTYEVRLPASLRDEFGQTLGETEAVSFTVGAVRPFLHGFPGVLVTSDPMSERPLVSVVSAGHSTLRVDIHAVGPDLFESFQQFLNRWNHRSVSGLPGRRLATRTVEVPGGPDRVSETRIELGDFVDDRGHLLVAVSPTRTFSPRSEDYYGNLPTVAWVQVTSIGLDAIADRDELVAWATDLRDGSPLDGATVRLGASGPEATTGADGLAELALTSASYLTATRGGDSAILNTRWHRATVRDVVRWFAFDDRKLYRPGEEVHVKGWVRRLRLSTDARLTTLAGGRPVRYVVRDGFGHELAAGEATLNDHGGFDLRFRVPANASLGTAHVRLAIADLPGLGETTFVHRVRIAEFRRPDFEVVTRKESAPPYVFSGPVTLGAVARYFAGGVLTDAPVTWQVTKNDATYSPPNWGRFTFGVWKPWWIESSGRSSFHGPSRFDSFCCEPVEPPEQHTFKGRTDATGSHFLQLDFDGEKPDLPITVSANAAVADVNRQRLASTVDVLVHPATLYVGLRSARTFVREGEPIAVEAIVTDIDGAAVAGRRVEITAARVEQKFVKGEWTDVESDPDECTLTSSDDPRSCEFDTSVGGQYKVSSTIVDDRGGRNRTELTVWVSGADAVPSRTVDREQVVIVPAREGYEPGDTAELLVLAPFASGEGVLAIARNGIRSTQRFEFADGSATLRVPITEDSIPGIELQVDLAGTAPRERADGTADPDLPRRPAFATGTITLPIRRHAKELDVEATPADREVAPGGRTTVAVKVSREGRPVADADVALVVVDEAVLSLTGYRTPNPLTAFFKAFRNDLRSEDTRSTLQLVDPEVFGRSDPAPDGSTSTVAAFRSRGDLHQTFSPASPAAYPLSGQAGAASGGGTAGAGGQPAATPFDVRRDFDPLAVFVPSARTDGDGDVQVDVDLPDNLTRYRVMAVAADDTDHFGAGESTITARLPITVRATAPRFANFGDEFELSFLVQNQTDEERDVDVVVQHANLDLTGAEGKRVSVPANDRVEVRFGVKARDAGTARFRVAAVSGDDADAAEGGFPVYTPVTTEAFATYGVLDRGAIAQTFETPTGVVEQFGGLEIDTSSTALQALTDAVVYLDEYPYESADAFASRLIALVALRDVFAAFGGEDVPSPDELDRTVRADVAALADLQNEDGGFSSWRRGEPSDPYVTVQATHAFVVARAAGYEVPAGNYDRALGAVRNIDALFAPNFDEVARRAVKAYALYTRNLAGERDSAEARALYRSARELPLDALAWLWAVVAEPAIEAAIERTLANRVTETPAGAHFMTDYEDSAHLVLASDRRTDGIVLDALITMRPGSELIPKVVNGLLGNQVKGRWNNVQENGFILLALEHYFDTFEAQTPSFVARAWLGDRYMAEHTYRGRSIERSHTIVPMRELAGDPDIVLAKDGTGRLYYRLGLRYAPDDLRLDPRDEGFVVERTYEAIDDEGDVVRDENGTWRIAPGAMVRVRLTMVADSDRTNIALVDPLPAGLEIIDESLAASPRPRREESDEPPTWFGWTWYDHQDVRDDRAQAFGSYLHAGTYEYTYVALATTYGTFVVPPARAEEIYAPEVFGRSASDRVVVGER